MNSKDWTTTYADSFEAYQKLGSAAEDALLRACHDVGLGDGEIAEISYRVKKRESLAEKATRKRYDSPLDATDIVGARIVFLFKSDAALVEEIACSVLSGSVETGEIERVDHVDTDEQKEDLGYRAVHFVGYLDAAGIPLVRSVPVEIQVRTVGQHAWALLEKGLTYKTPSAVPRHLIRNVLGLSILYELADDRFSRLREKQLEYEKSLQEEDRDLSAVGIDLDSMREMLQREFALDLGIGFEPELSWLLHDLDKDRYQTAGQVADVLRVLLPYARDFLTEMELFPSSPEKERLEVALALALSDERLAANDWPRGMSEDDRRAFVAFRDRRIGCGGELHGQESGI